MSERKPPSSYAATRLDIYDADIYLAGDKRQWRAVHRHTHGAVESKAPETDGQVMFALFDQQHAAAIPAFFWWVDIDKHPDRSQLVNTIAHEAAHVTKMLLDHIGHQMPVGRDDEPAAYLTGWLSEWAWKHLEPMLAGSDA